MAKAAKVKLYYWNEVKNFGDRLSPLLLNKLAEVDTAWDTVSHADLVCIGSVLEHIPPLWDGIILGAGKLHSDSRLHLHTNTANILALRGPYSASGVPGDYAIGDPGLLAPYLFDKAPEKRFDLGIVPHFSDSELAKRPEFHVPGRKVTVIDPREDPLVVVSKIAMCHRVVTSSLHGMIVADSFNIPRRFETTPLFKRDGGHFKLHDYSQSVMTPLRVGVMQTANSFHVQCRQRELVSAFLDLGDLLCSQQAR